MAKVDVVNLSGKKVGTVDLADAIFAPEQVTVRNLRIRGIDLDENLLMVEGAVPGSRQGYVLISKAKNPPRERRGFAEAGRFDPLKAAKKARAART